LDQSRRALRIRVAELGWEWPDQATLALAFRLPPGAYATTVLREVVEAVSLASFPEREMA
jgi:tRNA pseudouridine13 synthase